MVHGTYAGRTQMNGYGGYPVVTVDRLPKFVNMGMNHFADVDYTQITIPNMDDAENMNCYARYELRPHFWGWVYLENPQGERSPVYLDLRDYNKDAGCYDGQVYTVSG